MTSTQLRAARATMRLTQADMARLMGMPDAAAIGRLESGRREPTKKDAAAVKALLLLNRHGLLSKLMAEINKEG